MSLPIPSSEQREIIDTVVSRKYNIVVDAVAGSGKTTLCMHIAKQLPNVRILILTYNKDLKAESRVRASDLGLENVEVHTYHSLCRKYYGESDYTDEGIDHTIKNLRLQDYDAETDHFGLIILDESQDINDMYYRLFRRFYDDLSVLMKPINLMLIGDRFQMIYRFKGADERYLTRADEKYAVNAYEWKSMSMHETFRITKPMAEFVNRAMLSENRLVSNKPGGEVIYDCGNAYARGTLLKHISKCKDDEIMLLAPSIKSKKAPVRAFANFLSDRGSKVYAPVNDDSIPDQRDMRGKVAVLTYHQAKGLERKVVIVFNFDVSYFSFFERHADPKICPNTLYVACTRAKEKLVVLHHSKAKKGAVPFGPLPFLNMDAVKELCDIRGKLVETWEVMRSIPSKYSVTQLCSHLNFEQVRDAHNFYEVSDKSEDSEVPRVIIGTKDVVHTYFGAHGDHSQDRIETVSEISGTAVPMMFAFYIRGSITSVLRGITCERIIQNIPLTRAYKDAQAKKDVAKQRAMHLEYILKRVPDFLMQANLYNAARSGYVHKVNQIKTYNWMTPEQARQAIMRIADKIISGTNDLIGNTNDLAFETEYAYESSCTIDKYSINYTIAGVTDCQVPNTLWEFKFTDTLQAEHEIQLALYALLTDCKFQHYRLFNVKTGEIRELVEPNQEVLKDLADMLMRIKVTDAPEISEVEFFRDAVLPERPEHTEQSGHPGQLGNFKKETDRKPRQEDIDEFCDL